jgi:rabenosyn-5
VLCSTLFVVDAYARQIEEVGEGVDYGVKRRKMAKNSDQPGRQEEEDKFLKGVRICRECRPILLCVHVPTFALQLSLTLVRRQQYYQQSRVVPDFAKLYDVCNFCMYLFFRKFSILQIFQNFISLEADIEESLPNFQELLMTLRCGSLTKKMMMSTHS